MRLSHVHWVYVERLTKTISSVLQALLIANHLGPELFGEFNYLLSLILLLTAVSSSGIDQLIIIRCTGSPELFNLKTIIQGKFLLLCLSGPILFFYAAGEYQYIVLSLLIVALRFSSMFDNFFQSQHSFGRQAAFLSWIYIFALLAQFLGLVFFQQGLLFVLIVILIESCVCAAVGGFLFVNVKANTPYIHGSLDGVSKLLRDSAPFILTAFSVLLYSRVDQVMLVELHGAIENGYYSSAVRIVELFYVLPMILGAALTPRWAQLNRDNQESFHAEIKLFFSAFLVASIMLAAGLFVSSRLIISILYGAEYVRSVEILKLYAINLISVIPFIVLGRWQSIKNLQKYGFYSIAIGLLINVILNYFMIPLYGGYGAALSTIIARTISAFMFLAMPHRVEASSIVFSLVSLRVGDVKKIIATINKHLFAGSFK